MGRLSSINAAYKGRRATYQAAVRRDRLAKKERTEADEVALADADAKRARKEDRLKRLGL